MPQRTHFYGSLTTDKPMPQQLQEHLEFLCDLNIGSFARPLQDPLSSVVPDGFPAYEIAELGRKHIYTVSLCAESDTELRVMDEEYPGLDEISLQTIIDAFLKPAGIKATGRIEAVGEDDSSDLWCLVVGDDQVARTYPGVVVYEDQPGHPKRANDDDPARTIGSRLLDWAAVDPSDTDAVARLLKSIEFSTIPEAAADVGASFTDPEPFCDECQGQTEPGCESEPSPDHYDTCSLYIPDPENEA